jgi:hypothetical protein
MNDNEKKILQHVIIGVDLEILNYKCDYVGIQYSKTNGYYFINNKLHITYEDGSTGKSLEDFRLILRPLSDLNKEIEFNENLFIPNHHPLFKIFINADMDWFIDNCPFFVDYGQVQKLLEWHFDVFGLIEKGLAIDINTLK